MTSVMMLYTLQDSGIRTSVQSAPVVVFSAFFLYHLESSVCSCNPSTLLRYSMAAFLCCHHKGQVLGCSPSLLRDTWSRPSMFWISRYLASWSFIPLVSMKINPSTDPNPQTPTTPIRHQRRLPHTLMTTKRNGDDILTAARPFGNPTQAPIRHHRAAHGRIAFALHN
ncbi:hypothetical protein BDP81DRAFT_216585 [Colletotrichum phormii]|uniref:Uncharacterized protein n=1 Tax=Colletotrichum phormii TaxID=359342 RepID=A0AAI9ZRP4_9PEZI|nr:uncharacterized protein BDP81DRAFT_216585 [Colletotrichum phormii]KAK1636972.1 hypothetical protein BDP81DRAFT_216585 [Colletotrichum phormii]